MKQARQMARLMLDRYGIAMIRKQGAFMTDVRAWLIQLGITVIECVFIGCGGGC
jgi:hypothetical protein